MTFQSTRPAVHVGLCIVLLLALAAVSAHLDRRAYVDRIYTPAFTRVTLPPASVAVRQIESHLHRDSGQQWLRQLLPNQGGTLWLSAIVLLVVSVGSGATGSRIGDLVLAQTTAWLLFGSLDIFESSSDPVYLRWLRLDFEIVGVAAAVLWARTFWLQRVPYPKRWVPRLPVELFRGLAAVLVVLNLAVVFVSLPDDSSYFSNLGGQRLRERNRLPYGDPMLTATPGAAYPPVLYLLHAGVQSALGAPLPEVSDESPALGPGSTYPEPPRVATQLVIALAHLVGLAALGALGAQLLGTTGAWAVVSLYAGSAYLLQVAGTASSVSGLTFVSHIVPSAATLLALAVWRLPILSGALLALSVGLGFYPVFFFPIWASWHSRHGTADAVRFTSGFGVVCLAIVGWVLAWSQAAPGLSLLSTVVRDTLGHHSDPNGYGLSLYGLWGQQTGIMGWLGTPLLGTATWSSPFFMVFLAALMFAAWLARTADLAKLSLLTAGAGIGANLWKIHATATYVAWYYPFLVLGLLAVSRQPEPSAVRPD